MRSHRVATEYCRTGEESRKVTITSVYKFSDKLGVKKSYMELIFLSLSVFVRIRKIFFRSMFSKMLEN